MTTELETRDREQAEAIKILDSFDLPPEVLGIRCEIAENSERSDALWLVVTVSATRFHKPAIVRKVSTFIDTVQQQIIDAGISRFPYVRMEEAA